jgi:hypothetical protein
MTEDAKFALGFSAAPWPALVGRQASGREVAGSASRARTAAVGVLVRSLHSSPSVSVSRPGSVQRVDAIDEEMDEKAGALSTW